MHRAIPKTSNRFGKWFIVLGIIALIPSILFWDIAKEHYEAWKKAAIATPSGAAQTGTTPLELPATWSTITAPVGTPSRLIKKPAEKCFQWWAVNDADRGKYHVLDQDGRPYTGGNVVGVMFQSKLDRPIDIQIRLADKCL